MSWGCGTDGDEDSTRAKNKGLEGKKKKKESLELNLTQNLVEGRRRGGGGGARAEVLRSRLTGCTSLADAPRCAVGPPLQ